MSESHKTVEFKSRSRRAGYTAIDNPVLLSKKLSAQAKVLWGLLCYYAREDESCYPGHERLAERVPCSERALRNYIAELARVGLIEVVRRGLGKTNLYRLGDLDHLEASPAVPERQEMLPGSADYAGLDQQPVPVHVTKTQKTKTQDKKDAPGGARANPKTVDRRSVTAEERAMAWGVLDAFNELAGTSTRARGFVEKIVRRMREHPELDLGGHRKVIATTLNGERWWSGRPDPAIVYGSDTQFERCLNQTQQPEVSVHSNADERDWDAGMETEDSNAEPD